MVEKSGSATGVPAGSSGISVADEVKKIIADHLIITPELVTDEASFRDDLRADSLDNVEIIMAIEDTFNIEVNDEQLSNVSTVSEAILLVEKAVAAKVAASE